jgi:hypothetical protein
MPVLGSYRRPGRERKRVFKKSTDRVAGQRNTRTAQEKADQAKADQAEAVQVRSAGQDDDGRWLYLVLWADGTESWQPASNLSSCEDLIMELWTSHSLPCPHFRESVQRHVF